MMYANDIHKLFSKILKVLLPALTFSFPLKKDIISHNVTFKKIEIEKVEQVHCCNKTRNFRTVKGK